MSETALTDWWIYRLFLLTYYLNELCLLDLISKLIYRLNIQKSINAIVDKFIELHILFLLYYPGTCTPLVIK